MIGAEKARTRARGAPRHLSLLTGLFGGTVDCFVRVLARCGLTPEENVAAVRDACERIPASWAARARRLKREIPEAPHVLTVWFSDAAYLNADGKPRPLPLEGDSISVTSLVRSVDREADPREVLAYLVRSGAVRRKGKRYVPRMRGVLLRGVRGPDYFHTLHVLTNFLGTLEHNLQPRRTVPGRFERFVANPHFPVSQLETLYTFLQRQGEEVLPRVDLYMHQRERCASRGSGRFALGSESIFLRTLYHRARTPHRRTRQARGVLDRHWRNDPCASQRIATAVTCDGSISPSG
jgi:hypothetical protein